LPKLNLLLPPEQNYLPDSLRKLIELSDAPGLGDGPSNEPLRNFLLGSDWRLEAAAPSPLLFKLCQSGLWLLAGDLDRSHSLSQEINEPEGSFWHGIMHRREHDFSNAKYWFRRVDEHPVLDQIADVCGAAYRDPFSFVDACAQAIGGSTQEQRSCKETQWFEWQLLMQYCLKQCG